MAAVLRSTFSKLSIVQKIILPSAGKHFQQNSVRGISTSTACFGKRNFRKFSFYNKRGTKAFRREQMKNPHPAVPFYTRGVRMQGIVDESKKFHLVPEMVPELIVPNLEGCQFKPYVSYRVPDIDEPEFTNEDLFQAVYVPKICEDFKKGALDEDGNPVEPSAEEKLTSEEAFIKARQTGSDIF